MKILMINSVCGIRSTGRICTDLADSLVRQGHEVKIAYGREEVPQQYQKYAVRIGNAFETRMHGLKTRILDAHGFGSKNATEAFLEWAEEYAPDILHLHNLHGYYINVELLFEWIKKHTDMKVIWTLHDCWAFTGHCAYFTAASCSQWRSGCKQCIQKEAYPASHLLSNSRNNFIRKRKAFTGVKNMTIVTPSVWLAELVKTSFLKKYTIRVIHNGIDLSVFKPIQSDFRQRKKLEEKKLLLGVASTWDKRKGLDDFVKLSSMLDDSWKIVLVGLSTKQMEEVTDKIIKIENTNSINELVEIYTAADLFLNLTYEDNYPTVNMEAQACGTPVITYRTGGSVESVPEGNIAEVGDLKQVINILNKAKLKKLSMDKNVSTNRYLELYNESGCSNAENKKIRMSVL